ncbi:unnamed protein product [Microthlaspi erraticum]|uniref:Uncharacterized protein n=1 Tax=Microthlaspi erraticum TaxID=1685480 RepID=A0A6D2IFS7_9BRAS|nr:unnamed protein product [Microthlaspi erraticum]CAA7029038.1 unnamed protein product [Microthlaspi erraticum]
MVKKLSMLMPALISLSKAREFPVDCHNLSGLAQLEETGRYESERILYQTCVAVYKIRNGLFSDFLDIYSASSLSPEGSPSPVAADSPNRR